MPEAEFKENEQLVEELCHDRYNNEILRFFSRHPYTRFDKQVIIGGLGLSDTRRIELALDILTGQKLLEKRSRHGAPLYWLTQSEPVHSAIKYSFTPKVQRTGDVLDRLGMMQLIMPLNPCPVMAASTKYAL